MSKDSVEEYGLNPLGTMILEEYREKMPAFEKLKDFEKVGITAGASTPKNIIEEVHTKCQR